MRASQTFQQTAALGSEEHSACGFVIESTNSAVYFAGDTGYGEHFGEIAQRFSIDVALLPVGAYKPYEWFKDTHLNPETAVRAFTALKAKMLVPIHWGTFKISDEPLGEPAVLLQEKARHLALTERVRVLNNGESFRW